MEPPGQYHHFNVVIMIRTGPIYNFLIRPSDHAPQKPPPAGLQAEAWPHGEQAEIRSDTTTRIVYNNERIILPKTGGPLDRHGFSSDSRCRSYSKWFPQPRAEAGSIRTYTPKIDVRSTRLEDHTRCSRFLGPNHVKPVSATD